jgi:hypothetical protein
LRCRKRRRRRQLGRVGSAVHDGGEQAPPAAAAAAAAAIATPATAAPADPTTVTTAVPVTPRPPAPTTPPKTNPPGPVSGTRVTVLPSTGKVGSSFLFQFAGFRPGGVNVTVTDPNGTTTGVGSSAGLDGSGSFTFTTKVGDPVGRYSFRIEGGGFSVTTTIQVTAP